MVKRASWEANASFNRFFCAYLTNKQLLLLNDERIFHLQ
jgi:hypothetical protein